MCNNKDKMEGKKKKKIDNNNDINKHSWMDSKPLKPTSVEVGTGQGGQVLVCE